MSKMGALHLEIQEELLEAIDRIARRNEVPVALIRQVLIDLAAEYYEGSGDEFQSWKEHGDG